MNVNILQKIFQAYHLYSLSYISIIFFLLLYLSISLSFIHTETLPFSSPSFCSIYPSFLSLSCIIFDIIHLTLSSIIIINHIEKCKIFSILQRNLILPNFKYQSKIFRNLNVVKLQSIFNIKCKLNLSKNPRLCINLHIPLGLVKIYSTRYEMYALQGVFRKLLFQLIFRPREGRW